LSAHKWFKGPIAQGTAAELEALEAKYEGSPSGAAPSSA